MKFLADMGISPRTVAFLGELGHDAAHLNDLGLARLPDSKILAKARQDGRIVLTHDLDFADLMAASGDALPSVVIFRLRNMRPSRVNMTLQEVLANYGDKLQAGAIISVREGRAMVRSLPI